MRQLYEIAREIAQDWERPYFGAVPYLQAMKSLVGMDDYYGADDAHTIVLYFLSNAQSWKGTVARRVKVELKALLEEHKERRECPY